MIESQLYINIDTSIIIVCTLLPGNQSFYRQLSRQQKGGGVGRVGQWIQMATEYKIVMQQTWEA